LSSHVSRSVFASAFILPISPPCRAGREARAVPRLHQPKHTPHCVDAATNANDPRHLCDRCRSGRQRLRREPGGKVTRDHSDVETPQDRLLVLAIKQEFARRLDATLRRVRASPLMMRVITTAPHDERVATAPSHPLRRKKSLTRAYTSCSRGSSVTRGNLRC
jgi:hypothetical protein